MAKSRQSHGDKNHPVMNGSLAIDPEGKPHLDQLQLGADQNHELDSTRVNDFAADEASPDFPQVAPLKYRSVVNSKRKFYIVGSLVLGLVVMSLGMSLGLHILRSDLNLNKKAKISIDQAQKQLEKYGLGAEAKVMADSLMRHLTLLDAPGSETSAAKAWRDMDCKFLIQEALSRRFRKTLDTVGQYFLSNCQLAYDVPQAALRQITEKYGDANQFLRSSQPWDIVPLQLLAVEAQWRLQTLSLVGLKNYPACQRWSASQACFLKFVDQARHPVRSRLDEGYAILQGAMRGKPLVLQAWLAVAAAWNFAKFGDSRRVELLLNEAAALFPKLYDPFLEREVFRLRMLNAYRTRDKNLVAALWKSRPRILMADDEAGFGDTVLLRALFGTPEKIGTALDEFFGHAESYQRFRFDSTFIRIIIEQSIRHRRSIQGLTYLDRIAEQQNEVHGLGNEWLPLLRARLFLAQENGLEALQILRSLEKLIVRSHELAHLKGTAILLSSTSPASRQLAAAEFQKAANLDPRPEHFFSLMMTFLDAKDLDKADTSFKFWKKMKPRPGEDVWRSLAYGLLVYGQGNEAVATQIWKELIQRNPGFETTRTLLTNLSEDPNYLKDQMVKRLIPMLPIDGPLSPLVVFQ